MGSKDKYYGAVCYLSYILNIQPKTLQFERLLIYILSLAEISQLTSVMALCDESVVIACLKTRILAIFATECCVMILVASINSYLLFIHEYKMDISDQRISNELWHWLYAQLICRDESLMN